eukprot:3660846-Pyramimonas_sp.AAC.1
MTPRRPWQRSARNVARRGGGTRISRGAPRSTKFFDRTGARGGDGREKRRSPGHGAAGGTSRPRKRRLSLAELIKRARCRLCHQ